MNGRYGPEFIQKSKKRNGKRFPGKLAAACLGAIILAYSTSTILYYSESPRSIHFLSASTAPLNIAHQGGRLAPPNTIAAFDTAASLDVDMLEMDIHMTKDGELVVLHDEDVDRTTDGTGPTDSYTLEELQKLDAAYSYQDENGEFSYRGKGLYIPTLKEVLERYGDQFLYSLEIKDDYLGVEKMLYEMLQAYGLENHAVVTSFDDAMMKRLDKLSEHTIARSSGLFEALRFALLTKLWLPGFFTTDASVVQLPVRMKGVSMDSKKVIEFAHRNGLQVHYWTINDKETMKRLLDIGADGIITDRPDVLKEVIEEYELNESGSFS